MSKLPDKELNAMFIKMLTDLGRRMDEHSENFNKKYETGNEDKVKVTYTKNTITAPKNILEVFNSTLDEAEKKDQ